VPLSNHRWFVLCLSYLCMLVFAFALQCFPPILPLVVRDLGMTHGEAGMLMSLFALPAIALAVLAGRLSDRVGPFRTGLGALSLVIVGHTIFATSRTLLSAAVARVVAGAGGVTVSIVAAQVLTQWFRGREIGTAMGIYNTAMPVGTIVCFNTFGRLGESLGWRAPIVLTVLLAGVAMSALVLFHRLAPDPTGGDGTVSKGGEPGLFASLLKLGVVMWLVGLCWMWFNAAAISFSTFAPDFLTSRGYAVGTAGSLASLLMWGSLVLSPAVGRLLDRVGNNEVFIAIGGAIMACAVYAVPRSSSILPPFIASAVAVALVPSPVFSFPARSLRPRDLGLGFGVLGMLSSTGMVFGPYVTGLVRARTGSYETSFLFVSIMALFVTMTALVTRVASCRRQPAPPVPGMERHGQDGVPGAERRD
jgi:predicted MFS family arabinose efflux permease